VAIKSRKSTTLLIHGTFGANGKWWRWPYGFPKAVDARTKDVYKEKDAFWFDLWPSVRSIRMAGEEFYRWCQSRRLGKLTIIAHSHGGNLVIHAMSLGLKVDTLILLGTPVRNEFIPPQQNTGRLFNIYHRNDGIQALGASSNPRGDGRILPEADENIEVSPFCMSEGADVHSELHTADLWYSANLWKLL